MLGKPATYYLKPASFPHVKDRFYTPPRALANIRRDRQASPRFIDHNLAVLHAANVLGSTYHKRLQWFSASELNLDCYTYFPKPLPDAYLALTTSSHPQAKRRDNFLSVAGGDLPFFVTMKKLANYLEYVSEGEWEAETSSPQAPAILVICETSALQNRLHKRVTQILGDDPTGPTFATTSTEDLGTMKPDDDAVWRTVSLNRALVPLPDIKNRA